jgi:signal transduction histidine kinase
MSSTLAGDLGRSRRHWSGIRSAGQATLRNWPPGVRSAALAIISSSVVLGALMLSFRFSVEAGALRAAIETVLVVSGLVSAWLIWSCSTATRDRSDFLLLAAVLTLTLTQFAFFAVPAMVDSHAPDCDAAMPLIAHLEVAGLFAAAALVRRGFIATRRQTTLLLAAPLVGGAALAVGALMIYGHTAWSSPDTHPESTATALVIALTVPAVLLMFVAAVGFVRSVVRQRRMIVGLLGAAAILLSAAWSQSLHVPGLTANSVSGRECVLVAAFGLILFFASRSRRRLLRAQADDLSAAERRRLVCDLHDGMAQDLAFIATFAEHLVQDFGAEHPLTVAARRALAASRGFITDLSASNAPNAAAALQDVADELSMRHGVCVTVEAHGEDLTPRTREALVRIAREAIVNAVRHGQAQHIAVSLENHDDELTLRICDDGGGLTDAVAVGAHQGFGLGAMRERAEALGGDLVVRERSDGGTAVEAVVS